MSDTVASTTETNPYRLPTSITPSHYSLHLTPDLESETFTGNVDISIDTTETVSEIVLNAKEIELEVSASGRWWQHNRSVRFHL